MRPADQERRGPSTLAARAAHLIRRSWNAYWERRARRATVLLLRSLGPRTLADIGIKPGEIESVVYGSSEDRRRPYDAAWRRRTYC
jgi:uncharacterized protein YjiS (DUF1127 family)